MWVPREKRESEVLVMAAAEPSEPDTAWLSDALTLTHCEVGPSSSSSWVPIGAPLSLAMKVAVGPLPLAGCHWEVRYTVDCTAKRVVLPLGRIPANPAETIDYAPGTSADLDFALDALDVSGVKRNLLLNVGLLTLHLIDKGGEEVVQVSLVVQCRRDTAPEADPKAVLRCILSPLE